MSYKRNCPHYPIRVLEREEFKMKKTMILFVLGMIGIITTIYQVNKGEEMNFKYTEAWGKEILELASSDLPTEEDGYRLINLIEIANNTKDKKVIQTLMECLCNELYSIDQTIYENFNSAEYSLYYTALFDKIAEFLLTKENRSLAVYLLDRHHKYEFSKEEWEMIYNIANKSLTKLDIEKLLLGFEEEDWYNQDYPFPEFYKLFKKLLKEKSEQ